jgi:hypothetical protein
MLVLKDMHDLTAFATLIFKSVINNSLDSKPFVTLFNGCLNIKLTYSIIEDALAVALTKNDGKLNERVYSLFTQIK